MFCYPSQEVSVAVYNTVYVYSCSDGRTVFVPVVRPVSFNLTVETYRGYPVTAVFTSYTPSPTTFVVDIYYGSTKVRKAVDVQSGTTNVYLLPGLPNPDGSVTGITRVDVYDPTGLLASLTPSYTETDGLYTREIQADSPMGGLAVSYGQTKTYFSYPIYLGSSSAKFFVRPGLQSYIIPSASGYFYYGTDTGSGVPHVGFPYVAAIGIGGGVQPSSLAVATAFDLSQIPNAILSFISSIPQDLQGIANAITHPQTIVNEVVSTARTIGSDLVSAATTAWQWATQTKLFQIGPFSVSVADVIITAASIAVPVAAGAVLGGIATDALIAAGLDAGTAALIGRIATSLGGGIAAFVLDKLTGQGNLNALADAALTALAPWLSLTKFLAVAIPTGAILAFLDHRISMEDKNAKEKSELTVGSTVAKLCTNPALSLAPISACSQALSASTVPQFAVTNIAPLENGEVIPPNAYITVTNLAGVGGTVELKVVTNVGVAYDNYLTLPGGSSTTATVAIPNGAQQIEVMLIYDGYVVFDRAYPVRQTQQPQLGTYLQDMLALGVLTVGMETINLVLPPRSSR